MKIFNKYFKDLQEELYASDSYIDISGKYLHLQVQQAKYSPLVELKVQGEILTKGISVDTAKDSYTEDNWKEIEAFFNKTYKKYGKEYQKALEKFEKEIISITSKLEKEVNKLK